jgi:hypothetical protein
MGVCPHVSDALSYAIQWTDYLSKELNEIFQIFIVYEVILNMDRPEDLIHNR